MARGCVLSWRLSRSGKCVAGMNINFQSVENEACTLSKKFNKGELGMTRIRKYHKYGNKEREGGSTTDVKQTVCVGFSIYLLAVVLLPARCRTHRSLLQTFKPFRNRLVLVCLLSWGDSSPVRRSNIRSSGGRKSNTKPWNQDSHATITTSENLTVSY